MPTASEATPVRAGRRISEASIVWTAIASTAAVVLGVAAGSVALVAFGAIGYVDLIGSVALVHHFRHALRHDELSDRFERRAHRIVTIGLMVVGVVTIAVSVIRLAVGQVSETSAGEIIVATASVVALAFLSARKLRIARAVPSAALRSDGHVSMIGATQATIVLLGATVVALWSWSWADNVAATVVGGVAIVLGATTWRRISNGD